MVPLGIHLTIQVLRHLCIGEGVLSLIRALDDAIPCIKKWVVFAAPDEISIVPVFPLNDIPNVLCTVTERENDLCRQERIVFYNFLLQLLRQLVFMLPCRRLWDILPLNCIVWRLVIWRQLSLCQ